MKHFWYLALIAALCVPGHAQVQSTPVQTITVSSPTLSATVAATCIGATPTAAAGVCGVIPNTYGAYGATFEEIPIGSPTGVTVNVYGCMRGTITVAPTCDTVADSNTSTTKTNRGVTFTKPYGVFVFLATLTGGTTPSVTINPLISTANSHTGGGGSFTPGGDLSGTSSSQEVVGLLSNALPSLSTGFLNWTGSAWAFSSAGTGTVTSAVVAGTANQITASGTCTITTTGTCTLSLPSGVTLTLPNLGTPASGTLTNTTGYLWNNNAAPSGNLSIANGANTSIFTTTTGVSQFFAWKNNTAALVGTSQSSPINSLCGTEWHASASVEGCLALQFVPGTGTDAANSFNFTHTGSATGLTTANFPGPVAAGAVGSNPGAVVLPGNTGTLTPIANTAGFIGPNSASFTATWYQLPITGPSGTQSLECGTPSSNISSCSFVTVGGGSFPLTVSGTVTSGGIPYFSSTTQESSSGAGTANAPILWGGAGTAPGTGHATDNGVVWAFTEGATISPTSTTQVGLIVNNPSGTSAGLANFNNNGVTEVNFSNTGEGLFGAGAPTPTLGTGGGMACAEGTAFTGVSTVDGLYCNSTNHALDLINGTTDYGSVDAAANALTFTGAKTFAGELITGELTETGAYTGNSTADSGSLIVMNCTSACAYTFNGSAVAGYTGGVVSVGTTTATVSLNSKNFNGATSIPVLIKDQPIYFTADSSGNFWGTPPLVAGTNITLTPATNGVTIAASGGGTPCTTTANSLQYDNAGAFGCVTDWTASATTLTAAAAGLFDASAATGAASVKLPAVVGGTQLTGTVTANLSTPIVIQNTDSSNNNTPFALGVTTPGTSTGQVTENINGATTQAALTQWGTGGSYSSGVLSGQTVVAQILPTGEMTFGASAPTPTTGTGGGVVFANGTAYTGVSATSGLYGNSTRSCADIINVTTDWSCALGAASVLGNLPVTLNFAQTTNSQAAFTVGETTAATGTTDVEAQISTLTTSTSIPLQITQGAAGPAATNAPAVLNISAAAAGGAASASINGLTGAPITLITGAGSAGGATTGNGGTGGAFNVTLGAGGAHGGTTTNTGGVGGAFSLTPGAGTQGAATGAGGAAGTYTIAGAAGGAGGSTSGTGGAGSDFLVTTGTGGAATSGSTTGRGGNVVFTLGSAGGTGTAGAPGQFEVTGGTVAAANTTPFFNETGTWNTTGVVDAGIFENITNTASGSGSKLIDLQASSTSQFALASQASNSFALGPNMVLGGTAPEITTGGTTPFLNMNTLLNVADACKITSLIIMNTTTTICSWTLPATAKTWAYQCQGTWESASVAVTLLLGTQFTQSPTVSNHNAIIWSTNAGTQTSAGPITNTGTTAVTTLTGAAAAATATGYPWQASGSFTGSATSGTFVIYGTAGTSGDAQINAGSTCTLY
jgi:hypothetical protein